MGRAPASQFYWGDLRRDTEYHLMNWSARGIWVEILACMHFSKERGKIEGTPEQLSRLIGCTLDEFQKAKEDISVTKTGDVTEGNGFVTIINRRMFREERERILTRSRVQKFRNGKKKLNGNEEVTPPSSSPSPKEKKIYKRKVLSDEEWEEQIKKLHPWINWEDLNREMDTWLLNNPNRQKTRKFITNWILNKQKDKPMKGNKKLW